MPWLHGMPTVAQRMQECDELGSSALSALFGDRYMAVPVLDSLGGRVTAWC